MWYFTLSMIVNERKLVMACLYTLRNFIKKERNDNMKHVTSRHVGA